MSRTANDSRVLAGVLACWHSSAGVYGKRDSSWRGHSIHCGAEGTMSKPKPKPKPLGKIKEDPVLDMKLKEFYEREGVKKK